MAAAQYFEQVQKIFIAFYQRPADPAGLKYWAERVDAAGGDINQVINAFASSPEAVDLYGAIDATTDAAAIRTVIDKLYLALFDAPADFDAAGKQFYVDGFMAGTFTAGSIALSVLNGAQNDDLIAVNNKVQVANEFTQQVDGRPMSNAYFGNGTSFNVTYAGDADAIAARDILKGVTFLPSTVISPSQVTEALKAQIADPTDPIIGQGGGQTFTLTTGLDALTGTTGDDTFNADHTTFTAVDAINGGAGIDTLNYTDGGTVGGKLPAAVVSNVEIINIRNVNGTAAVAAVAPVAAVSEQQTVTVSSGVTSDGPVKFLGVDTASITAAASTATTVADAIVAAKGAILAGTAAVSAGLTDISNAGGILTLTFGGTNGTGNVANIAASASSNGVTFTGGTETVAGKLAVAGVTAVPSTGVLDTVDALNFVGATNFNSNLSTNAVTFDKLAAGQQVGLTGNGSVQLGAVTAAYNTAATASVINVAGGVGPKGTTAPAINVTGSAPLVAATINSTGAANTVGVVTLNNSETSLTVNAATNLTTGGFASAGALKTVTVSGAATTVDIGTLASTNLTSVDASGLAAGGVKVGIGANLATTFKGGAGNDTVTIAGSALMTGAVDGGAGADTLALSTAASLTTATGKLFTNFETLQVSANGTDQAYDLTKIAGITSFKVAASTNVVELTNLAAAPSVTVIDNVTGAVKLTLKDATGAADVVNVTLDNGKTDATVTNNGVTVSKLTAANVETINIHSNGLVTGAGATANTITANDVASNLTLSKVNIDGSQAFSFATGNNAVALTVDASTATGNGTITGATATKLVNINGGLGNDTITAGGAGGLVAGGKGGDAITLGAGTDTLVFKAASDSVQDFTGTAGVAGKGTMDVITGFLSGTDKIDLTSLNFSTTTSKVVVDKVFANVAALTTAQAAATFFQDAANTVRGVVVAHTDAATYLVVDANHDGLFSAAADLVIQVGTNTQTLVQGDVIFG